MTLLMSVLIIITCLLLIAIVLIQNPKGGGLSSSFGGSGTQMFGGVKKTTDFLDRGTWTLSIVLVVLVLVANVMLTPSTGETAMPESEVNQIENTAPAISAPAATPAGELDPSMMPQGVEENEEGDQ